MDWLQSPLVQMTAVGLLGAILTVMIGRKYQRCPHCQRMVPRATRGWLRCRACGRQYHRSVHLR